MDSDLIRKSDVMKTIYWYRDNQPSETTYNTVTDMADDIHNLPTADVVEVVRCKDCKYWQDNNNGYPHEECRWGKDETPDTDDYCSYGKKVE